MSNQPKDVPDLLGPQVQQAHDLLSHGDYREASQIYQQCIETAPGLRKSYWYYGLTLLLQGCEEQAQLAWVSALMEGTPEEIETWTTELVEVLEKEAVQQCQKELHDLAYLIRLHLHEIAPNNLANLLAILNLLVILGEDLEDSILHFNLLSNCQEIENLVDEDKKLLTSIFTFLLEKIPCSNITVECLKSHQSLIFQNRTLFGCMIEASLRAAHILGQPIYAIQYAELGLECGIDNTEVLRHLASFYTLAGQHERAISAAQECYEASPKLVDKLFANHLLLKSLTTSGGRWNEVNPVLERQYALLGLLDDDDPTQHHPARVNRLWNSAYEFPYVKDDPQHFRLVQNKISNFCQQGIYSFVNGSKLSHPSDVQTPDPALQQIALPQDEDRRPYLSDHGRKLKIGYISHCMKTHSVGWLARWLIRHHNRSKFEIYGYFLLYKDGKDSLQNWYVNQMNVAHTNLESTVQIAQQIHDDKIDILVDLDSITLDRTCEVMSLKPAPIQLTWLGWDASGIPNIDYFIADPYVLPENAQEYYREKIWRLPQTYLAIDGFEVGVPRLRRSDLNIPDDAVIYFSSQKGFKRHPEMVRLQLKILKEVPNSYFLIKGISDQTIVRRFFEDMADEMEVSLNQLRFLELSPSEAVHRANLSIADVVLDTFPYNGATTTMETLWMEIPLVTKVGEQFASRNSYTMMKNAGITEGVAWSDSEYLEWGIRFGKNPELRQKVAWKLKQSKKHAHLWNAKQFTQDMEDAYQKMWSLSLKDG